jgi:chlorobactene glucosyltransferase
VADDSLSERLREGLTHLCALAAVGFAGRAAAVTHGWLRVPPVDRLDDAPLLSIVVPARDEERAIERCVRSLLAQRLPAFEVIVVDDRSTDRTGAILDRLAAEEARLHVGRGAPLPDGWVGKPWALAQGVRFARGAWLLFTDADTWHAPHATASAFAFARARGVDALSLGTYQELRTFAERAILPTMLGLVLVASGSMAALNDPADREHALANGQYLLVSRAAYDALGGHTALRGEIVEDLAFARRLKTDGRYRLLLAGGEGLVRVRMYTSLGEIWSGFTKNLYLGADGDLVALAFGTASLALLSVIPAALGLDALVARRPLRALEAVLVLAVGVAIQDYGVRQVRLPRRLAWFAPLGYVACAAIVLNSTARVLGGRGVVWRGRRYTGRVPESEQP